MGFRAFSFLLFLACVASPARANFCESAPAATLPAAACPILHKMENAYSGSEKFPGACRSSLVLEHSTHQLRCLGEQMAKQKPPAELAMDHHAWQAVRFSHLWQGAEDLTLAIQLKMRELKELAGLLRKSTGEGKHEQSVHGLLEKRLGFAGGAAELEARHDHLGRSLAKLQALKKEWHVEAQIQANRAEGHAPESLSEAGAQWRSAADPCLNLEPALPELGMAKGIAVGLLTSQIVNEAGLSGAPAMVATTAVGAAINASIEVMKDGRRANLPRFLATIATGLGIGTMKKGLGHLPWAGPAVATGFGIGLGIATSATPVNAPEELVEGVIKKAKREKLSWNGREMTYPEASRVLAIQQMAEYQASVK